jgi:hypothetical protein
VIVGKWLVAYLVFTPINMCSDSNHNEIISVAMV